MICELCKTNNAETSLVEVLDGVKKTRSLCLHCAEKSALGIPEEEREITRKKIRRSIKKIDLDTTCPTCTLKLQEFQKLHRFGCSDCYSAFQDYLAQFLPQLHGSSLYLGKKYASDRETRKLISQRQDLLEDLQMAIQQEQFELAAELRDKLKNLEEERK